MGLARSRPLAAPRGGETVVVLRQAEALDFLVGQPAVSTTTVYEGDALLAAAFLRERVALVVKLNPWLGGRLFWSDSPSGEKPRKLHLAYDAAAVSAAAEAGDFFEFVALDEAKRLDAAYSAPTRPTSTSFRPPPQAPSQRHWTPLLCREGRCGGRSWLRPRTRCRSSFASRCTP